MSCKRQRRRYAYACGGGDGDGAGRFGTAGGSARSLKNPSQGTRWILYSGHWSVGNLGLLGFVHAASNVHGKHFGFSG